MANDLKKKDKYLIHIISSNLIYYSRNRNDDTVGRDINDQFNNQDLEINNENYNNPKVMVYIQLF